MLGTTGWIVAAPCALVHHVSIPCKVVTIFRRKSSFPILSFQVFKITFAQTITLVVIFFFIDTLSLGIVFDRLFFNNVFRRRANTLKFLPLRVYFSLIIVPLAHRNFIEAFFADKKWIQGVIFVAMSTSVDTLGHIFDIRFFIFIARSIEWVIISTFSTISILDAHAIEGLFTVWTLLPGMVKQTVDIFGLPSLHCLLLLHP
jgi:hypothetical protein